LPRGVKPKSDRRVRAQDLAVGCCICWCFGRIIRWTSVPSSRY
jgi:hypothetical protein